MKKYELMLEDVLHFGNVKLYRIRALKNFGSVVKGELGGYIESERNLSHSGNAWVAGNAVVLGNAIVRDNAHVSGDTMILGNAIVRDNAYVSDDTWVADNAIVSDYVRVTGNVHVSDDTWVADTVVLSGKVEVSDKVRISGNVHISGDIHLSGDAVIQSFKDYCVFKNTWSSGRFFIYTRSNKKWRAGCFYGTGEELIKKAYSDSELSGKNYELFVNLVAEQEKLNIL